MLFEYLNYILLFFVIKIQIVELYIVIPLKSTDNSYSSEINDYMTINNNKLISNIFSKWVHNYLYTDLIIGEPNQKATAFLSTEEYDFIFYEEYSTNELKELNINHYNEYLRNKSQSIMVSNELNLNFSFWEYLSFEEPFIVHKFDDNEIFSIEKFNNKKILKTNNIHFLYVIRHSSKVFNTSDFIEFEKRYQESKNELRKLNYTSFSYFCLGLQLGGKFQSNNVKNILGEFLSKHEITSNDWSIYFIDEKTNKDNDYIGYLFLGSTPHQYLSNIYDENEVFYTDSENYQWTWRALLTFYKIYIKLDNSTLNFNDYQLKAKLDFNFDIIKGTWQSKTVLEELFFGPLINSSKCFESTINKNYYSYYTYFYCDKNKVTKNDLIKYPTIYFHHLELGNIFELTYEDLFETIDDIIFFKIVFDTSNEWTFGRLFLKKYLFSYNDASKKIYFYNKKYSVNSEKEKEEIEKKYYYIEIIVIIVLLLIAMILGFFIGRIIYKKYKKGANELENINNEVFFNDVKDEDSKDDLNRYN